LGISHISVGNIRKQTSPELSSHPVGQPGQLSSGEVAREIHTGRCKNASAARKKLFPDFSTAPSLSTIRRTLRAASLKRYGFRKKNWLIK